MKRCPYHNGMHRADDFVMLIKGKHGRSRVPMCRPCFEARKTSKQNPERFAAVVAENVAKNKRAYMTTNSGVMK